MDQQVDTTTGPSTPGAAPQAVDLAMTSEQVLSVQAVQGGVANLEVRVSSWGWRRAGAYQPVDSVPPPWHVQVGPDGNIQAGRYWAMAQEPPLPGVDFFSGGLPSNGWSLDGTWSGSWPRTLDDGTALAYDVQEGQLQATAGQAVVQTTARYQLTRRAYAADAQPTLVEGSVQAVLRSTFDTSRRQVLQTSYTSSFTMLETEPQGTAKTEGKVVTTIRFQY
jgi:hypothetical protein